MDATITPEVESFRIVETMIHDPYGVSITYSPVDDGEPSRDAYAQVATDLYERETGAVNAELELRHWETDQNGAVMAEWRTPLSERRHIIV